MVTIEATYDDGLRCTATHGPSGTTLITDAPKDNMGQGASFSPTDLVATALGCCALTTMGIVAQRDGIPFRKAAMVVVKHMAADPRRIAATPIEIRIHGSFSAEQKEILERAGRQCPVARSLHVDIDASMRFVYVDDAA